MDMKKLITFFKNHDKQSHFWIFGFLPTILGFWYWPLFLLGFVCGIVKELIDKYIRKTKFDTVDMIYTWAGSSIAFVIHVLINVVLELL